MVTMSAQRKESDNEEEASDYESWKEVGWVGWSEATVVTVGNLFGGWQT
jgi:hypothetical protein